MATNRSNTLKQQEKVESKKRTFYSVLMEELNISLDDSPEDIAKNLKKSVADEIGNMKSKKSIYDAETDQAVKRIKTNVDNALDAIKKITSSTPAPEEVPEEEMPPEEETPPEEAPPPPPQLPPEEPVSSKAPKSIPKVSDKSESQKRLDKVGESNKAVKLKEKPIVSKMQQLAGIAASQAQQVSDKKKS